MTGPVCEICLGRCVELYPGGGEEGIIRHDAFGASRRVVEHGQILRCLGCGFGFQKAIFNEEALCQIYRKMDGQMYEGEAGGRTKTAGRHLRIVKRHATEGRLLDVGCASGSFLRLASEAGWEVTGIEPSETLYEIARTKLQGRGEVRCESFENSSLVPASFDAITVWDVLEHVPSPARFLAKCRLLLKPEGRIFLTVPNLASITARMFGQYWPLLLPEHLSYFTRRSLTICGKKGGIEWVSFTKRPSWLSIGYILHRLSQHGVPGAKGALKGMGEALRTVVVPVYLGEICAVGRAGDSAAGAVSMRPMSTDVEEITGSRGSAQHHVW